MTRSAGFVTLASFALASIASQPVRAQQIPGWTYATNITFDSGSAGRKGSIATRYQVTDNYLRTEFLQVAGSANAAASGVSIEGMYSVMSDKDSTLMNIMPSQKVAMIMRNPVLDLHLDDAGPPSIQQHLTRYDVQDLGVGEKILGHATHHYRTTTEGSLDLNMGGKVCTMRVDGVDDIWYATDVNILPAIKAMGKHYSAAIGDAQEAETKVTSGPQLPKGGTPLRSRMTQTRTSASGKPITVTTTMEYVELSNAPIDESLFRVPEGFQVMDMRKMMARLPQGMMDSVKQAVQEKASAHSGCE